MNLEDKVNKIVGEIMTSNISNIHGVVRDALIEQDRETRNACADSIVDLPIYSHGEYYSGIDAGETYRAIMNANPWK